MFLCLTFSVSSALALIAVPVCSVFHSKSLTVDAVVLYILKTRARVRVCVCVCGWVGRRRGMARYAALCFLSVVCCCPVFVDIALQLYPESVSLIREYFLLRIKLLILWMCQCPVYFQVLVWKDNFHWIIVEFMRKKMGKNDFTENLPA
jgi:hypothetical protein